jgi:FMN-dependent NADH-azoreductase
MSALLRIDSSPFPGEASFSRAMRNFRFPRSSSHGSNQIARAGKTFAHINGGPAGLLRNKKATFLVASGAA